MEPRGVEPLKADLTPPTGTVPGPEINRRPAPAEGSLSGAFSLPDSYLLRHVCGAAWLRDSHALSCEENDRSHDGRRARYALPDRYTTVLDGGDQRVHRGVGVDDQCLLDH